MHFPLQKLNKTDRGLFYVINDVHIGQAMSSYENGMFFYRGQSPKALRIASLHNSPNRTAPFSFG